MHDIAAPGSDDPAKYKKLLADLRAQIRAGTLSPGEQVPSITRLATDTGWARQTCARALRELAAEGVLTRCPGLGYHVSARETSPTDKRS
jgi:DNA-binding GntR family transcriptional regulator